MSHTDQNLLLWSVTAYNFALCKNYSHILHSLIISLQTDDVHVDYEKTTIILEKNFKKCRFVLALYRHADKLAFLIMCVYTCIKYVQS